jgi:hypothetical protein
VWWKNFKPREFKVCWPCFTRCKKNFFLHFKCYNLKRRINKIEMKFWRWLFFHFLWVKWDIPRYPVIYSWVKPPAMINTTQNSWHHGYPRQYSGDARFNVWMSFQHIPLICVWKSEWSHLSSDLVTSLSMLLHWGLCCKSWNWSSGHCHAVLDYCTKVEAIAHIRR